MVWSKKKINLKICVKGLEQEKVSLEAHGKELVSVLEHYQSLRGIGMSTTPKVA